jgi:regulator of ribonuclease activity B
VTTRAGAAVVATAVALAAGAAACGGGSDGSAGDGAVKASFYAYFSRPKDADEAAAELRENGYSTEIRAEQKVEWLVIASRKLERGEVDAREGEVRFIAYRHDGDYDGSQLDD